MLALATDTFGTLLWPDVAEEDSGGRETSGEAGAVRSVPPGFLRSIMPALDCAFGLPPLADAPDALLALAARLMAGPLGAAPALPAQPEADDLGLRQAA